MAKTLKTSDVNHLRRLIGWVRCEAGQTPEQELATYKDIAERLGVEPPRFRQAVAESLVRAYSVPQYVHAAIKALEKVYRDEPGEIVDGENVTASRLESKPAQLYAADRSEK